MNGSVGSADGFIVLKGEGKYLNRDFKWASYSELSQAYVHKESAIVAGGPWASEARTVIPATYVFNGHRVEVKGAAIPIGKLFARTIPRSPRICA